MENNDRKFNHEATDSMRMSLELSEEIKLCDKLIEDPNIPENIKKEMKLKKEKLRQTKAGSDYYIHEHI